MNKKEFLKRLREGLKGLPLAERENALSYYDEMISDKIDSGMTEREAVESFGDIYKLRAYITAGSVESNMKEKRNKNPFKGFFIVMAVCSSPFLLLFGGILLIILLSLTISFAAVTLSLFASAGYMLVASVVNSYHVWADVGAAGGMMSFFACLFAAALLILIGILFLRISVKIIKLIVRFFARLVKKNNTNNTKLAIEGGAV